jgi:hypothetical protein
VLPVLVGSVREDIVLGTAAATGQSILSAPCIDRYPLDLQLIVIRHWTSKAHGVACNDALCHLDPLSSTHIIILESLARAFRTRSEYYQAQPVDIFSSTNN